MPSTTSSISVLDQVAQSTPFALFQRAIQSSKGIAARGAVGSSTTLVVGAFCRQHAGPVLLMTAHLDEADDAVDVLQSFDVNVERFPALEIVPGETGVNVELLAERLRVVRRLQHGEESGASRVIVAPVQGLMQLVPDEGEVARQLKSITTGQQQAIEGLLDWLGSAGYRRVDTVDKPGDFAVRGGILDVFSPSRSVPVRVDFFGDEVESIWEIDLDTMASDRRAQQVELVTMNADQLPAERSLQLFAAYLPEQTCVFVSETLEIYEQARGYFERVTDARGIVPHQDVFKALRERCSTLAEINQFSPTPEDDPSNVVFPVEQLPAFSEETAESIDELCSLAEELPTIVCCQNEGEASRLNELLSVSERTHRPEVVIRYVHRGFIWRGEGATQFAIVPYHELLHRYHTRRRMRRISGSRAMDSFLDLEPGDMVVHRDHGTARFLSIGPLEGKDVRGSADEEFLTLEFAGGTRLHVPALQIDSVQKYVGGFSGKPKLSPLGGKTWKRQKREVAEAVQDLAAEMLRIQAAREALPGVQYPSDTRWQTEFEAEFPYEETEDQLAAIAAVKRDMAQQKPMDRLICGDVGFGKTEVAIRAAFKAAEFGKQVAVLVPTTVLAEQHEQTFRARFADYPFRIASISRFKTRSAQQEMLREVAQGRVDIIIGTHRLLSQDVRFADLGLVIIDEEQRFGIEHKNRLLGFRMTADVLTLSATPIPRTLHMSMLGLRDISSLATAPSDRRSIVTEVSHFDKARIKRAIERELAREGQVYFVHNRVHNIKSVADDVQRLAPDARIVVGHGQMSSRELESVMLRFMRRQADILVCTTIIESGIDIPTANTMFINNADMFGLSELHQLRGRVGRYKHRAYCYLLLPDDRTMTETAVRRLRAVEEFSMLGAGFKIAMRDLEIRGAGNLLGPEQSGHISAVGYEMYCELLHQAVTELKEGRSVVHEPCTIDLGVSGSFSKAYIPADTRRLEAYRRIARASSLDELKRIEHDLVTAYGSLPKRALPLFDLAVIRIGASALGVRNIRLHEHDIIFRTSRPTELGERFEGAAGTLRLVGQSDREGLAEVYYRPPSTYLEPESMMAVLRRRLQPASSGEQAGVVA